MNFPCMEDLRFFNSKRVPAWAWSLMKVRPLSWSPVDHIHYVVNEHARLRPTSGETAAGNLLAILAGYRRRGVDLEAKLLEIARHPECAINPEKRAAFAKKWARRLAVQDMEASS